MSLQSHIQQLKQRHDALDTELEGMRKGPSVPDNVLADVKRRKLALKDQISRLSNEV